ncbi:NucA/NucB deoxyribonuclease domain-containing protein [Actinoplanes sp. NPDC049668]|uniref:NucA/NucB deoxyribonuclease domain-containing protein n=1 Tax=unclassified Actinoplanes TaxID=2626549 RepID=UPI0033BDFE58
MRNNIWWRRVAAVTVGLVAGGGIAVASAVEVAAALPSGCLAPARGQPTVTCVTELSTGTRPQRAPAPAAADSPVPCVLGVVSKDRLHACVMNRYQYDIFRMPQGTLVGTAVIQITQASELRYTTRKWRHEFTLDVLSASGELVAGVVITPGLTCDDLCDADELTVPRNVTVGDPKTVVYQPESEGPGNAETTQETSVTFASRNPQIPVSETVRPYQLPMVRCDSSTVIDNTRNGGCVYPEFEPTFTLSLADDRVNETAEHIRDTQAATTHHWGLQPGGTKLRRTTSDTNIAANREAACPRSLPRPTGKSCDEYPFASTSQGAAMEGAGDFSRRMVDARDNSRAGSDLGQFYRRNRILGNDAFWVEITTF